MYKYDEKTTGLLNQLFNIKSDKEFDEYVKCHTDSEMELLGFFGICLEKSGLTCAEAIKNSGISKGYAYQILNLTRRNPARDKVICLGLGAHMDINDMKRFMELTGWGPLYPRNTKDAIIIKNINMGKWNVVEINEELFSYGIEDLLE